MLDGEYFSIQLWDQSTNQNLNVTIDWEEGTDYYTQNGINIASVINVSEKHKDNFTYISCFPNPSSGVVNLEFSIYQDEDIDISVF